MEEPFITVLVTAYQRKEYLNFALASLINQTIKRDLFEIIVITDFRVDWPFPKDIKVKFLETSVKDLGPKIASAIELSSGNILCFIEDDDVWTTDRLQSIYELFSQNKRLGYYHNGWEVIDEKGRRINHPIHLAARRKMQSLRQISIDPKRVKYGSIRALCQLGSDFNSSSIALRKDIVMNRVEYLRKVKSSTDSFYFYSALLSGYEIRIDSKLLTLYRIHNNNFSRRSNSLGNDYKYSNPDYNVMIEMVEKNNGKNDIIKSIRFQASDIAIESFWIWGIRDRISLLKKLVNHLQYISIYELKYNSLLLAFATSYLLFPGITERFYSAQYYSS